MGVKCLPFGTFFLRSVIFHHFIQKCLKLNLITRGV
jgi:hypothetical protein